MSMYQHPSYASSLGARPTEFSQLAGLRAPISGERVGALATADRACCCIARPSVIVYLPLTGGHGSQADLLLCMHHYRASRHVLARRGATALDATGDLVTDRNLW